MVRDDTVAEPRSQDQSSRRTGSLAGAAAYLIWGLFPLYFYRLRVIRPIELACLRIVLTSLVVWNVPPSGHEFPAKWANIRS